MRTHFALILVAVLCLSTGGPAYAEWAQVSGNDELGLTVYAEPDSIRRKGDLAKIWELMDYKTPQTVAGVVFLSVKTQMEYDCAEERMRLLALVEFSGHMGEGNVVYNSSDAGKWQPVSPGSTGQTLWKFACGKK